MQNNNNNNNKVQGGHKEWTKWPSRAATLNCQRQRSQRGHGRLTRVLRPQEAQLCLSLGPGRAVVPGGVRSCRGWFDACRCTEPAERRASPAVPPRSPPFCPRLGSGETGKTQHNISPLLSHCCHLQVSVTAGLIRALCVCAHVQTVNTWHFLSPSVCCDRPQAVACRGPGLPEMCWTAAAAPGPPCWLSCPACSACLKEDNIKGE